MVDKLSEAKANGYWLDKIASMSVLGSSPATSVAPRSPTSAPAGGVSKADLDRAIDRASRAEAAVADLTKRVERLETELHAVEAVWTKH
ncbi:MAG: hypothetical protein ACRDZ7_06875 [Acidimicrobiia bacterium]